MYKLSHQIDWKVFETEFGPLYHPGKGPPGVPMHFVVGLHYLKHAYDAGDEAVVEPFLENHY